MTVETIREAIAPLKEKLSAHPLYSSIETLDHLRIFMQHHVYAVWDFMSLVKALQRVLTCVDVPWVPRGDPTFRRYINELVLLEESDSDSDGDVKSQFEVYLAGMQAIDADIMPITRLLQELSVGTEMTSALEDAKVPPSARGFVLGTFATVTTCKPHEIAAALCFGRELLLPTMINRVIDGLSVEEDRRQKVLRRYFQRRVDPQVRSFAERSVDLVDHLCGADEHAWESCIAVVRHALSLRLQLWDATLNVIQGS